MNVVLAIVTNILFGLLTSHLAQRRGRDGTTWFVVGVLLGLLGVILLYLFPNKQETVAEKGSAMASLGGSGSGTFDTRNNKDAGAMEAAPLEGSIAPDATSVARLIYYKEHDWFYLDALRAQQGPIPFEDLRLAARSARISAESYIWCDGMPEWKHLQDLPEVFTEIGQNLDEVQ